MDDGKYIRKDRDCLNVFYKNFGIGYKILYKFEKKMGE